MALRRMALETKDYLMLPTIPETYREALRAIQNRERLQTNKWREQQWRAIRDKGDPQILLFERLLVRRLANIGVPMFCNEVVRDNVRQRVLYEGGYTKLKADGPHTVGAACDIVHSIHAWDIPVKSWALIGHVGKEIIAQEGLKIRWGGDWKFYDPAHWELTDWKKLIIPF